MKMWILAVNYLFLPITAVYSQGDNGTGLCPHSWTSFEGSCYIFLSQTKTWEDANSRCKEENATLVTISSAEENNLVSHHTDSCGLRIWIGLNDIDVEDTWQWLSNETSNFSSWGQNEPNNINNENCVELHCNGKWNDVDCESAYNSAFCEKVASSSKEWSDGVSSLGTTYVASSSKELSDGSSLGTAYGNVL
ncbi:CD209 antigen-like protein 2 isoform X2 [Anneissia japonica]|uniref:CD209 antigen-like protein 2 isoform X2 n=1 Tax=Anneissia japonica TaxID=1529436 RepID=UPI001425765E|nr:CD209 antigen-like protein 2 isoform X2 [Anneissia japonica]